MINFVNPPLSPKQRSLFAQSKKPKIAVFIYGKRNPEVQQIFNWLSKNGLYSNILNV